MSAVGKAAFVAAQKALHEIGLIDAGQVEFRREGDYLQWRKVGDTGWSDLVPLADITGEVVGSVNGRPFGKISSAEATTAADGTTDDSAALQALLDNADGRAVEFIPGATYRISTGLVVDVSKVRGIIGNNATLLIDGPGPAITLQGSKSVGSATPLATENQTLSHTEYTPFVRNLKIASYNRSYQGTGIRLSGTFGTMITECHLFNLNHGIEVGDINRNLVITDNVIWDCVGNGLYWNGGDCHQVNVVGNHISHCSRAVHVNDTELKNIRFTANDLEADTGGNSNIPVSVISIFAVTQDMEDVTISDNTIQDHVVCTGPLIDLNGGVIIQGVNIADNFISNAANGGIRFDGAVANAAIQSNYFHNCTGSAIERLAGTNFNRLQITGNRGEQLKGRFLHIHATAGTPRIQSITISDNIVRITTLAESSGVEIEGCRTHDILINDNLIEVIPTTADVVNIVNVNNPTHMSGMILRGNILRATALKAARAINLSADGNTHSSLCSGNVGYDCSDATVFSVPAGVTANDNFVYP